MTRSAAICTAAATPLVCWGAAAAGSLEPAEWLSATALRGLTAEARLSIAVAVIVGAPLVGVALSRPGGSPPVRAIITVRRSMLAVLALVVVSALLTLAATTPALDQLAPVWQSHATLASVALALVLLGAACGSVFRDPLDAAAVGAGASLLMAGGMLAGGARIADLPRGVIEAGMLASPLIAIAGSAHVDLLRIEPLYQISPLAHLSIDYPAWSASAAWHLTVASACTAILAWTGRGALLHTPDVAYGERFLSMLKGRP
jgi:hypothetical protein